MSTEKTLENQLAKQGLEMAIRTYEITHTIDGQAYMENGSLQ